jgi:sugar (pentulose or hexulose) kinase
MPAKPSYFLSIDCGTQSVRALIFNCTGDLIAKQQIIIEPYVSPQPGWAEQEADYFWQKTCEACQALWLLTSVTPADIKAVSITTQRGTMVNVGANGKALRPAISWLDQRQATQLPAIGLMDWGLKLLGLHAPVDRFKREAESNWISEHQPEIMSATTHWLLLSGYLSYCLTDELHDAVAAQVGYIPFDFKNLDWAKPGNWRYRALAMQREKMPELFSAGELLGNISPKAAELTGILVGTPLISSGSDKACEVLGSGCVNDTTGALSYGTTATFNINSSRFIEPLPFQPPYPSLVPGSYNVETMVHRGYWMVDWFRKEFGLHEEQKALEQNVSPEFLFDNLLREVPPGAMGLVLQPYWSSGANSEGSEAKGAIVGFGEVHTRAHIYRAIVEGIGFALREGKERLEKRGKFKIDLLRASGGGSQSDEILQITADLFNLPVERPHTYETSGLGAAMAAAVGCGVYVNFNEAVTNMVRYEKRFEPREVEAKVYDRLFQNVYKKLYTQLRPSYRAIRKITGYPT